jgi:sulfur-carrier protein adenylyltransferase/sulfurtransferase
MLSDPEKRRYRRHMMLSEVGEEGQEKLKAARVVVVGAGGLGAPILQYLTSAGVGNITILDDDLVSEDNLHRQILYGRQDMGKLKTIIARERLKILNPFVNHDIFNIRLKPENVIDFLSKFDVIVDATDNFSTRYLINDACILINKPWVFGSVHNYDGQVTTFINSKGPSLRCLYPDVIDKQNIPNPSASGILGVLPGIVGSIQASEVLKIILGIGDLLCGKLLIYNLLKNSFLTVNFERKELNFQITELRKTY